ncbi:MAG: hypothetical protein ABUS47_04865 [Steroidobacter sp.]
MKKSPGRNSTKDVAAHRKQKYKVSDNHAGTYTHAQAQPGEKLVSRGATPPIPRSGPDIRSSKSLLGKQDNDIPSSAAQGDDDVMSQEKTS